MQALTDELVALAEDANITVKLFSRKQVNLGLLQDEQGTKHGLAEYIAARFPDDLGFRLPPKRRTWMNQDYRMDIFDAVALAHHFLRSGEFVEDITQQNGS